MTGVFDPFYVDVETGNRVPSRRENDAAHTRLIQNLDAFASLSVNNNNASEDVWSTLQSPPQAPQPIVLTSSSSPSLPTRRAIISEEGGSSGRDDGEFNSVELEASSLLLPSTPPVPVEGRPSARRGEELNYAELGVVSTQLLTKPIEELARIPEDEWSRMKEKLIRLTNKMTAENAQDARRIPMLRSEVQGHCMERNKALRRVAAAERACSALCTECVKFPVLVATTGVMASRPSACLVCNDVLPRTPMPCPQHLRNEVTRCESMISGKTQRIQGLDVRARQLRQVGGALEIRMKAIQDARAAQEMLNKLTSAQRQAESAVKSIEDLRGQATERGIKIPKELDTKLAQLSKVCAEVEEGDADAEEQTRTSEGGPPGKLESAVCVICISETPTHAFVPCGHVCLCEEHAAQYQEKERMEGEEGGGLVCPVCRVPSRCVIRLYI